MNKTKKHKKKKNRGPLRGGPHTLKNGNIDPPPYGPFLHTHPQNVTLLGGPSNAIKRVGAIK